jgi:hypothetical protein
MRIANTRRASVGACLTFSLARPDARVWPPPGRRSWQFRVVWGLTLVSTAGIVLTGILDWNNGSLDFFLRLPVGSTLALGGLLFARSGMTTLGTHATLGLEGTLAAHGLRGGVVLKCRVALNERGYDATDAPGAHFFTA